MEKKHYKRLIKELKIFSFSFSAGMFILSFVFLHRQLPINIIIIPLVLSGFHLLSGFLYPLFSFPFFIIMKFALKIIGTFLTFIVFTSVFYVIITPISCLLRLTGNDHIKKSDKGWISHEDNSPEKIEKLY